MNLTDFKNRFHNCQKLVVVQEASDDSYFIYRVIGTSLTIKRHKRVRSGVGPPNTVILKVDYPITFYDKELSISFDEFLSKVDDKTASQLLYCLNELI